jgi:hypothetical protein
VRILGGKDMKEVNSENNFDEKTLKRLQFLKWLASQDGRPDRHGIQSPLPEFCSKGLKDPEPIRRDKPFFPEDMTGV